MAGERGELVNAGAGFGFALDSVRAALERRRELRERDHYADRLASVGASGEFCVETADIVNHVTERFVTLDGGTSVAEKVPTSRRATVIFAGNKWECYFRSLGDTLELCADGLGNPETKPDRFVLASWQTRLPVLPDMEHQLLGGYVETVEKVASSIRQAPSSGPLLDPNGLS